MEILKNDIYVNRRAFSDEPEIVDECDSIVPDTKPDILKVLQIDASVCILSRGVSDGKYTLGGNLVYNVLYVPESAKGVCSLSVTHPFSHTQIFADAKEGMFVSVSAETSHIEYNLVNSRKIALKSVVSAGVILTEKICVSLPVEIDGENIMKQPGRFCALSKTVCKTEEITIDNTLSISDGQDSIGEILKAEAAVLNRDVKIISGKVVTKGEISVSVLYTPENSLEPAFAESVMPFTEILDVEGISDDNINSVRFEIIKNDVVPSVGDSLRRSMDCHIRIAVHIDSDELICTDVISDAYCTKSNLDVKTTPVSVMELISNVQTSVSVKESVKIPDKIPQVSKIYHVIAKPYIEKCEPVKNKLGISGVLDTYVLYISAKDDSPVYSFKSEIPFKTDIDCGKSAEGCEISLFAETSRLSYSINAAGEIEIRTFIDFDLQTLSSGEVNIITSVEESEIKDGDRPSLVLYFVQKGDTLWNIAKRYHTKPEYIEELNNLDGQLCEGTQLLIPRG